MSEATVMGLALLALRIGLGIELVVHGWPKLKAPGTTAAFLGPLGFKPPLFWAWVLVATEFLGGVALLLGLVTRVAAALNVISFLVIILYLKPYKWKVPFTTPQGAGWEWDWLIVTMAIALLIAGSGTFGLDRALGLPF